MNLRLFLSLAVLFTLTAVTAVPVARAGDCFQDPVYDHDWSAVVTTGARVRDVACMEGSVVLKTLDVGTSVAVIGETDGWYKVRDATGTVGWIGAWLLSVSETPWTAPAAPVAPAPSAPKATSSSLRDRLKGYILLQVESHGEAWYLNPTDGYRYYMRDGAVAYEMMRSFGLGITNADLAKLFAGDTTLTNRLRGRILLQVEAHGEAYYVNQKDGTVHYMKDGAAAYEIMRFLSLGITNTDLALIAEKTAVPSPIESNATQTSTQTSNETNSTIRVSAYQHGTVPANVDVVELNRYWLERINELRAAKGLRLLVLDQRWVDTASEWAGYMDETNQMTHTRSDGKTMHQWIDTKGLDFTVRYSEDGWETNYFTENISWDYANGTMTSVKDGLENTLAYYLAEAAANGPHYRTIYHPDWNSVGVGFSFEPSGDGYKVYMAFHYGSLKQ